MLKVFLHCPTLFVELGFRLNLRHRLNQSSQLPLGIPSLHLPNAGLQVCCHARPLGVPRSPDFHLHTCVAMGHYVSSPAGVLGEVWGEVRETLTPVE